VCRVISQMLFGFAIKVMLVDSLSEQGFTNFPEDFEPPHDFRHHQDNMDQVPYQLPTRFRYNNTQSHG